ncbi:NAD(P)-dependent oxidoreductase [Sediminibacterium soli]|uniref:NAD(P)-dependent oxidoreductase n=1 Tax=Sediminibacterium soli TaxID=2698829 RepID=UPI001379B430|nr:NAD(P)-dependent oxidoreductase [Sediminibacterium soli]NCI46153.1 alanine dehydrogenase [Sediminibacterium soli]
MLTIGLIREGKIPADNRVALSPAQCRWLSDNRDVAILVQRSPNRCYTDEEYQQAGVKLVEKMDDCDILLGIKEVPVDQLISGKTYLFFSHTRKKQAHNRHMLQVMMDKKITLIDYECLEHEDGQRIIGFGFFAGIVGAHNGIMAYGNRTGLFHLGRVQDVRDYRDLIHTYFGLKLPPLKIAVTGSGRVAHGILEIMNLMDIQEVEPEEYCARDFRYPVYVQLKGSYLYRHRQHGGYSRDDFHAHPESYTCVFAQYGSYTDILMNGVYWDTGIPRLFSMNDVQQPAFRIQTIADITDDKNGSIPCNLGDATIDDPVYGIDKFTGSKTAPYLSSSIDIMAVGNLPNELPRDASRFFGEQLIKYVLPDLLSGGSQVLDRAMILRGGGLTPAFEYLSDYAAH